MPHTDSTGPEKDAPAEARRARRRTRAAFVAALAAELLLGVVYFGNAGARENGNVSLIVLVAALLIAVTAAQLALKYAKLRKDAFRSEKTPRKPQR